MDGQHITGHEDGGNADDADPFDEQHQLNGFYATWPAVSLDDGFFDPSTGQDDEGWLAGLTAPSQYLFGVDPSAIAPAPSVFPDSDVAVSGYGYAIAIDIDTVATPLEGVQPLSGHWDPLIGPFDSLYNFGSPVGPSLTQFALSVAPPIPFSIPMNDAGTSGDDNFEFDLSSNENPDDRDGLFPGLESHFGTRDMVVVASDGPSSWNPGHLLNRIALSLPGSAGSSSLSQAPSPQNGEPSPGISRLMADQQSDQSSFTLDAMSQTSFDGARPPPTSGDQRGPRTPSRQSRLSQPPTSPSTLGRSSGTSPLAQPAQQNSSIPFTTRVELLPAPKGFSHSHILVVTNGSGSSPGLWRWDSADVAELAKNIKMRSLEMSSQAADAEAEGGRKRRRMGEPVASSGAPSESLEVRFTSPTPITYSSGAQRLPSASSSTASMPTQSVAAGKRPLKRKTDEERKAISQIRKESACLRCRVMREKCSETRPCPRCVQVSKSARAIALVPCQRASLDDVELYRRRTQFGLFVYQYKHEGDRLPERTASIVNPTVLEAQLDQGCPLTVAETFIIESYGTFRRFSPHASTQIHQEKVLALQQASTMESLRHSNIIAQYLELHMKAIIDTLGTNSNFIARTLRVAEEFSRTVAGKRKPMLRNALYIFTARFLRRTYWVQPNTESGDYAVAWMDAPWRALPAPTPKSLTDAEALNAILKSHLSVLERFVLNDFTAKVYERKKENWFELFLVTFIFQVILSENLEMSFYSQIEASDKPIECPWSTFGGLRSYSSKRIASYFTAINGRDPFLKPGAKEWEGFGDVEKRYMRECGEILREGFTKKDDLGFRRSASLGEAESPGSWWRWAMETVLGDELTAARTE